VSRLLYKYGRSRLMQKKEGCTYNFWRPIWTMYRNIENFKGFSDFKNIFWLFYPKNKSNMWPESFPELIITWTSGAPLVLFKNQKPKIQCGVCSSSVYIHWNEPISQKLDFLVASLESMNEGFSLHLKINFSFFSCIGINF
jgi:hypothetical protein